MMNTSESEEDFESADEDLDYDFENEEKNEDVKTVSKKEDHKRGTHTKNGKDISETVSSDEIVEKLGDIDLKEGSLSVGSELIPKIYQDEVSKSSSDVSSPVIESAKPVPLTEITKTVPLIESKKPVPLVKELDTTSTDKPSDVRQIDDSFSSKKENQNRTNTYENKFKPMKLGMKLTPKEIETEVIVDTETKICTDVKVGEHISIGESHSVEKSIVKKSQTVHLSEETNLETGDGWEIEDEDGFDIPATLDKNIDGVIQCPQEQSCDSDEVESRFSKPEEEQGWGGWGGWGVGSLLSTASGTVTTFSSHVTAGLSTVIETTVGAPDPASLVGDQACRQEEPGQPDKSEDEVVPGYGGLGSIMSGVSFLGSSVINRGLDTLETIGKKTMEVLQEGDPGLKKKRAMLFQDEDKPILSQILREAKERADNSDKEKEEKESARKVHFESLFDDFKGMVHLEALEMLSTQCELKLQSLLQSHSGSQLRDLQETLSQVRDLCELTEDEDDAEVLTVDDFADKVSTCFEGLRIKMTPIKILKVNDEICARLEQQQAATAVNEAAILSLAELTAAAMECFHKSAELVMAKSTHNTADEADTYVQLTYHLCSRLSAVANEFTQVLTRSDPIANSSLITNIFLEASNSSSYVKNACQLLVPILQVGAVSS